MSSRLNGSGPVALSGTNGPEPPPVERRCFQSLQDYSTVFQQMRRFVDQRQMGSSDQFWVLQHRPVFTQGINGKPQHLLNAGDIPVVQSDRGGQVTYHGPGQLVCYLLLDLKRRGLGVRGLVELIEQAVIDLLAEFQIEGQRRQGAPGVYVGDAKIAALGLRVRRGCSYHGVSLNVDMDLQPFSRINPCGYQGLRVTQMADESELPLPELEPLGELLTNHLSRLLSPVR
ncbi:MAG TPA: octanoyltransferase [Gammaproteobacteria bacterium]|nr:octanoyltransferase [Gammaproteobacteria bacterium]